MAKVRTVGSAFNIPLKWAGNRGVSDPGVPSISSVFRELSSFMIPSDAGNEPWNGFGRFVLMRIFVLSSSGKKRLGLEQRLFIAILIKSTK
jgi:hypothetical protein